MSAARPQHVRVTAPAKLNLVLRVLAREATGYHGIESLFAKLQLHDLVTVHTDTKGRSLAVHGPHVPASGLGPEQDNLAWRAALAFEQATGWPNGFAIEIEKQIPVGGGLGGGSADAAAVLRGLNRLAPSPLAAAQLITLAGTLGADVPFLVSDALLAWSWGRGDRLLQLPPLPARPVTLRAFAEGVHTGFAYAAIANHRAGASATSANSAFAYALTDLSSWAALSRVAGNDFEAVVPAMHAGVAAQLPPLRAFADRLTASGEPAIGQMSGSGATCFLLYPDTAAERVAREFPAPADPAVTQIHTRTAEAIVEPEATL